MAEQTELNPMEDSPKGDSEFLAWLGRRLVLVYGESEQVDFVQRLKKIALKLNPSVDVGIDPKVWAENVDRRIEQSRHASVAARLITHHVERIVQDTLDSEIRQIASYVAGYKRDASFDDSQVGAGEHNANQRNIADGIWSKRYVFTRP